LIAHGGATIRGGPLHHRRVLVHSFHFICESSGDPFAGVSDTFTGIARSGIPAFIAAEMVGALLAVALSRWLWR
jgi:hypothetical protein